MQVKEEYLEKTFAKNLAATRNVDLVQYEKVYIVLGASVIFLTLRWSTGVMEHPKNVSLSYKNTNRCNHSTNKSTNRMTHVFKAPGGQRRVNRFHRLFIFSLKLNSYKLGSKKLSSQADITHFQLHFV